MEEQRQLVSVELKIVVEFENFILKKKKKNLLNISKKNNLTSMF